MGVSLVKPTVGRIVRYVPETGSPEAHNSAPVTAAVVVRTWPEISGYKNDEVNLKVLTDGPQDTWKTSVPYSEYKEPRTWHWPPRE